MNTTITNKKIWHISYPIILGSIAQNIITLTDTAFLGRVSEIALGAVALAGLLYVVFTMLAWGFSIGLQIVVARRYGENNFSKIGTTFEHGLGFIFLLSVVLFLILRFNSSFLLNSLIQSNNISNAARDYLNIRSWGIFFSSINYMFRGLYIGITKTRVISNTTIFMAIINIILDYIFIFGKFGSPAMGIKGAALASLIAEICAMIYFVFYTFRKIPIEKYKIFKFQNFNIKLLKNLVKISIPTMIQSFLSLACWFIFFLFVENLGERPLASSNIIRSIYMLVNVPVWAYGAAANTLTSQLIGANREKEIMPMLWKVAKMSSISVIFFVLIMLCFPNEALSIYTDNQELITFSLPSLYTISIACLFFGFSITYFQAISGTGKTLTALFIEIIVLLLYMFSAWYMAIFLKQKIEIVWTADIFYASLLGIGSFIYMKYGKWHNIKN